MPDLSIFKLDSQTITIKDTTARQTAESAKTLATAAATAGNAVREQITELKNDLQKNATENYTSLYDVTDNLLDTSIIGKWYPYNYGGSQKYSVHSDVFPVNVGDVYYHALHGVDVDKFGTMFRMIVNTLDSGGNIIRSVTSYSSDHVNHASITIESGEASIVATLTTRDYNVPITVDDILSSSMIAYLGKTDIIGAELYNKYASPKQAIQNDVSKNKSALRINPTWSNGTIDSTGSIYYRADRINTGKIPANIDSVECINGYYGLIAYYDEGGGKISVGSFAKNFTVNRSSFPTGTAFVAIAIHNGTGSISPSEGTNCIIRYSIEAVTNTLSDAELYPYATGSTNQICRLGWKPYDASTPPEQSLASYALAYKEGCRIMLCDVRVTSDGYFVLWHDETLNNTVRHTDGSVLSDTEKAMTIAGSTLAELNAFDYGLYKGSQYAGLKIPTLDKFLEWCSMANCWAMLEVKVRLTEAQCISISKLCKCFGIAERTIIDEYLINLVDYQGNIGTAPFWIANLPKATICIIGGTTITSALNTASLFINAGMPTLLTLSTSDQLTVIQTNGVLDYAKVQAITDTGTALTYTELTTEEQMNDFYDGGYFGVFKYVASGNIHINRWIQNKREL